MERQRERGLNGCWRTIWQLPDGRRWCSGCQAYLPGEQFGPNRTSLYTGGFDAYCRECRSASDKRSYQRHRARRIAKTHAWRARNPERVRAQRQTSEAARRLTQPHRSHQRAEQRREQRREQAS